MNKNKNFLPIGTVVRLKNAEKNIMIIGFCPVSSENNTMFDYCACLYPEGMVSSEINFLFNNEQIDQILYKGLVNDEEINFKKTLNEFMSHPSMSEQISSSNFSSISNDVQPQMFSNGNLN